MPWSLVAVNVAALAATGWLGALLARDLGRSARWGLLFAGYWGFLFTIGRDTAEVVAAALVLGGLLWLRRQRPVLAGGFFALAVLTRETAVGVVLAYGVLELLGAVRGRRARRPTRADAGWLLPLASFVGWQIVVAIGYGKPAILGDSANNLAAPFVDPAAAIAHYIGQATTLPAALWLGELVVLAAVSVVGVASVRWSAAMPHEKLAFVILLAVSLSLAHGIWFGRADFRSFALLFELAGVVALGSRRRLDPVVAMLVIAWVVAGAQLVVSP